MGSSTLFLTLLTLRAVEAVVIAVTSDPNALAAGAIGDATDYLTFTGDGSASGVAQGPILALGTFTNGPLGLESGMILSTGRAIDAQVGSGVADFDGGVEGSGYCYDRNGGSPGAYRDAAIVTLNLRLGADETKLRGRFIFATNELDG